MTIFQARIEKLNKLIHLSECDAFIIEDTISLYYLTGIEISTGRLIVHSGGAHLFVDSRYIEVCKKMSPFPVVLSDNGLPLGDILYKLEMKSCQCIGFSSDNTTYTRFLQLKAFVDKYNTNAEKHIRLKGIDNLVSQLRQVKDVSEIALLKDAAKLGSEGFDFVCSILKEGITELEVAVELEIFWKKKGGKALAFDPIIAFGSNSSMPHHRAGSKKLQKGDTVLIDIGVNYAHYHSDMTRVVYFGKPNPKILEIHGIVLEAQARALTFCKPHTRIGDLDIAARGFIAEKGYGEHFMHGLGHGVGLEIHEAPSIRNQPHLADVVLEEGMVITIEPGIYLSLVGGVRIEDTVVITANGHENLTNRPKEPLIIQ